MTIEMINPYLQIRACDSFSTEVSHSLLSQKIYKHKNYSILIDLSFLTTTYTQIVDGNNAKNSKKKNQKFPDMCKKCKKHASEILSKNSINFCWLTQEQKKHV